MRYLKISGLGRWGWKVSPAMRSVIVIADTSACAKARIKKILLQHDDVFVSARRCASGSYARRQRDCPPCPGIEGAIRFVFSPRADTCMGVTAGHRCCTRAGRSIRQTTTLTMIRSRESRARTQPVRHRIASLYAHPVKYAYGLMCRGRSTGCINTSCRASGDAVPVLANPLKTAISASTPRMPRIAGEAPRTRALTPKRPTGSLTRGWEFRTEDGTRRRAGNCQKREEVCNRFSVRTADSPTSPRSAQTVWRTRFPFSKPDQSFTSDVAIAAAMSTMSRALPGSVQATWPLVSGKKGAPR
jgi:hypothetical protein